MPNHSKQRHRILDMSLEEGNQHSPRVRGARIHCRGIQRRLGELLYSSSVVRMRPVRRVASVILLASIGTIGLLAIAS